MPIITDNSDDDHYAKTVDRLYQKAYAKMLAEKAFATKQWDEWRKLSEIDQVEVRHAVIEEPERPETFGMWS